MKTKVTKWYAIEVKVKCSGNVYIAKETFSVSRGERWENDKAQVMLTEHQMMSTQLLGVLVRRSHSGQMDQCSK